MDTLAQAQKDLRSNFDKGSTCPCCGQFVKQYKRKLNSSMARVLTILYHQSDYIHVKDYLREKNIRNTHDWTLLKYWGFISERPLLPEEMNSKSSGFWRITEQGSRFVLGETVAQKHVLIYNKIHLGFSEEKTDIEESLGNSFNYKELMNQRL
jgi:hypothetical protein